MELNHALAEYVVNTNYADLPEEVVEMAKKDIMDTIGVAVAAAGEAGGRELVRLAEEWGGNPECTVIGYGFKAPLPVATVINATTAHSLDYDDVMFSTGHVGVAVIPAALATAEKVGGVTGRDLITAVVLGIDVMCRLGEGSIPLARGYGWLYTPLYGMFGATAAAGKILGLTVDEMENAFGICYSQAAGTRQPTTEGSLVKRIQAGLAGRAGVFSALLAKEGVTGPKGCFDGKFGLFHTYQRDNYMPENITKDFGEYFTITGLAFKKFPACAAVEASVEATLELMADNPIRFENVDFARVHIGEYSRNCAEPLEKKQDPHGEAEAQFSVPWVVATALVRGQFTIPDAGPESLDDQNIRALAKKVDVVCDVETSKTLASFPARVEIFMKDGTHYDNFVPVATGAPSVPMSLDELIKKFRDNCNASQKKYSQDVVNRLVDELMALENARDVSGIMKVIA